MKLFVLLSSTENRYLILSRCSYIVLDEVSSFNLFVCFFFSEILNQTKNKLFYRGNAIDSPTLYSIIRLQKI